MVGSIFAYPYRVNAALGGGWRYTRGTGLHAVPVLVVFYGQCVHVLVFISFPVFCDAVLHAAVFILLPVLCYVSHFLIGDGFLLDAVYCNEAAV